MMSQSYITYFNSIGKKYTPCQGVVWSQHKLSGTFYVPLIFGLVLFAKVCFCLPMQFMYTMYHSQNSSFLTLLRFEESSISEVPVCNCQCNIKTMQNPTNIVDLCPSVKRSTSRTRGNRFKACRGGMSKPTSQLLFCAFFD